MKILFLLKTLIFKKGKQTYSLEKKISQAFSTQDSIKI